MARNAKDVERKVYVTIRSPYKRKSEKLETWRYWEIVGALQWMGEERSEAYEVARIIFRKKPGTGIVLGSGVTLEVTEE